jgi:hypothetical protein
MAYTTIVSGTNITSSWANASVRDQVVSPFGSTAARTAAITGPIAGMVSTLTTNAATEGIEVYNSAGQWRLPWNMPWGRVGSAVSTVNTTSIGSTAKDVTSLSVSWTAVANRYYRTTVIIPVYSQLTTSGIVNLLITDGTPTTKQSINLDAAAGTDVNIQGFVIESGITGSPTRKARILTTGGSGTVTGSATSVPTIIVEDIGPSGAPA